MIKCFLFDLDGVLIDSKNIHFDSLNAALSDIDIKYVISEEEQKNIYEGLPTNKKLKILTKTKGLPEYFHEKIWRNKQENSIKYFKNLKKDLELIDFFEYIKNNQIKIGVVSNSIKETIESCLKSLGVYHLVDIIISNEDCINSKPFPDMYNYAMEKLETTPSETVIFEDSLVGRTSAVLSRAKLVHIRNRNDLTFNKIINEVKSNPVKINVVIPMAGESSRFKNYGYDQPKYFIDVMGKKMIESVIDDIGLNANYIFIVRETDIIDYNIENILINKKIKYNIVIQNQKMDGAVKTILLASDLIDKEIPLIIANCDQKVIWNSKRDIKNCIESGVDGAIWTFKSTDNKWSFVKKDNNNFISSVSEKNPISDDATVGIYYWKNGSDFIKYSKLMIKDDLRINNEFYVCPVYNYAIKDEKIIIAKPIYEMWGLGTPEDLQAYLKENYVNCIDE